MKDHLPKWWAKGTTEAQLLASGVDLQNGFICTTGQVERIRPKSFDDDKLLKMCGQRLGRTLQNLSLIHI
eukprot:6716022-Prorocentrum_lima.AAC.1